MRHASFAAAALVALAIAPLAGQSASQPAPQPAAPLDWSADDAKRVEELTAKGERREGKLAVLFTPAGAIDDGEEAALLERLDKGLAELRAVIGRHPWQVVRADKIAYYISSDRFVSHASGRGAVFVPLVRVQDGRAPFLHEAAHELLATFSQPVTPDPARIERVLTSRPLWLTEGLADYTALTAASRTGVKEGDIFDIGGLAGADGTCRDRLKGPRGPEVAGFIGALGGPAALFTTERGEVAPTFYACGTSFTKFIVGKIGVDAAVALMPLVLTGQVLPRIETLTGASMDALRTDWRAAIGAQ